MSVSVSTTNKPLNPRAQDLSPKGYNRAALYSGKALDFDGVNDEVDLDGFTMSGNTASFAFYLKADEWNDGDFIFDSRPTRLSIGGDSANANTLNIRSGTSWLKLADISDTTNTNHFVITIDGTTAKLFLNGQSFGYEVTLSSEIDLSSNANTALMSYSAGAGSYFNGQIAGFKIFNTALTAAQVADLYNNPEKVVPTGVDNTALKLWLPMQEGAGTTAINGAPDAIGSELVTNGDFATDSDWTKEGSWTISGGVASISSSTNDRIYQSVSLDANKKYLLSINVTSISTASIRFRFGGNGSASNLAEITTPGIYNFISAPLSGTSSVGIFAVSGANATIDDISVKEISNNGTISGATWTHGIGAPVAQTSVIDWNKHTLDGTNEVLVPQGLTSGRDLLGNLFESARNPYALNLDGKSWAEVHDNASLDMTTTATLEAWVNADGLDAGYDIIMVKSSATTWTGNYGRYTLRAAENVVNWWFDDYANAKYYSVVLSGWNHLVVTKDGTEEKLYVNGVLASTQTGAATFTASPYSLLIGVNSSKTENWTKPIALPRIYNRALTATEVARNYNADKSKFGL